MSSDIFLMCLRDGEPATFRRELLEEIFRRDAVEADTPLTGVVYDDDSGGEISGEEGDEINTVAFSRCGGDTFFERLHELADRTESVVYWPSNDRNVALTRETTARHLPEDLRGPEPSYIVANGSELEAAIFGSSEPE